MIVTLDGNIGAGKSTALRLVRERLAGGGAAACEEPLERWGPALERLYAAVPGAALEFQLRVFLDRCAAAPELRHGTVLVERSPEFQRRVFVAQLPEPARGLMDETYRRLAAWRPDAYVYLRSAPEACAARVAARGRPCEAGLSLAYLRTLHKAHEMAAAALGAAARVLIVDVDGKSPERVADEVAARLLRPEAEADAPDRVAAPWADV